MMTSRQKLQFLLDAIQSGDFNFQFKTDGRKSGINSTLNRVRDILHEEEEKIRAREQYYSVIMDNLPIGIIVMDSEGRVFQKNSTLMKMFGLEVFTHINQLGFRGGDLVVAIMEIKPGAVREIELRSERGAVHYSLSASEVAYDGKILKSVTVSDIGSALDARESDSQVKLTRVLTHEIMNSLAPITSLSGTLQSINSDPQVASGLET
ncbi:MAG: ATP-binding protein, partial [Bacteroidales bacterium]|nr:ATP-binding protein [Bacteroidales bacterium]